MSTKVLISSAVRLRIVLLSLLGLLVILAIALGFFGMQYLQAQATDVQKVVYEAVNGDQKVRRIQELAHDLETNQEAVKRSTQIVAERKNYQNSIISDLQTIAKQAGVSIMSYTFTDNAAAGSATSGAKPATPAAPAAGGLGTKVVTISLKNPVKYRNLLSFLHYIEQNLTKMQVAQVSMSNVEGTDAITVDTLTIEVYTR